jgi:hypothetical protein
MQHTAINNQEAEYKAHELELWMDNTEELYNLKQAWIKLYTKKLVKGKFDLQLAIKGMDNLRKQIQTHYNKHFPESRIRVDNTEVERILVLFLISILYNMYDENYDNEKLKTEIKSYIDEVLTI